MVICPILLILVRQLLNGVNDESILKSIHGMKLHFRAYPCIDTSLAANIATIANDVAPILARLYISACIQLILMLMCDAFTRSMINQRRR